MMVGGAHAQHELVRRAKRLLDAGGMTRVPVADIAGRLGCSVSHLCRTFKRLEGQTITAYRAQGRLHRAMRQLRDRPDADLTQLALECGYCSHSHLTASFRRFAGTTPSAYAAALLTAPVQTPASADPYGRCNT